MTPSKPTALEQAAFACLRARRCELLEAAVRDDTTEEFPRHAFQILADAGLTRAVLPVASDGVGLGWLPEADGFLYRSLRALGGVHLSAARLFEGHVNAFQLLWKYGSHAQKRAVCEYVSAGELLGVWNAPSPEGEMILSDHGSDFRLHGIKAYASGAGVIKRPLITAVHASLGLVMTWPNAGYAIGPASEWTMHGMRSSVTRSVTFDCVLPAEGVFGEAEDYHKQPVFSGGSWRFLAAQLGAGEALSEMMRTELLRRQRAGDSFQLARMTETSIALDTAAKWILSTMALLSDPHSSSAHVINHANEARLVVERCLLEVMELVHRGVGLQGFSRTSPIERVMRDLATYLRQPAPDSLTLAIGKATFSEPRPGLFGGPFDGEELG